MPEIRATSFDFPRTRGHGPQTVEKAVVFPRAVVTAVAGITGYSVGFVGKDHHLGRMVLGIRSLVTNSTVRVTALLGLRDWSGNWDDNYAGDITAAVLAELDFLVPPLPSADAGIGGDRSQKAPTHLPPTPGQDGMKVVHGSVTFAPFSGSGPREATSDVTFARPVSVVAGLLTGFDVRFSASDGDHHLAGLDVRLDTARLDARNTRVTATFGLRDSSGNWDDRYEGTVFFSVVGE
jgi:hypothetical protein